MTNNVVLLIVLLLKSLDLDRSYLPHMKCPIFNRLVWNPFIRIVSMS